MSDDGVPDGAGTYSTSEQPKSEILSAIFPSFNRKLTQHSRRRTLNLGRDNHFSSFPSFRRSLCSFRNSWLILAVNENDDQPQRVVSS